jgi:hypothetical protein
MGTAIHGDSPTKKNDHRKPERRGNPMIPEELVTRHPNEGVFGATGKVLARACARLRKNNEDLRELAI